MERGRAGWAPTGSTVGFGARPRGRPTHQASLLPGSTLPSRYRKRYLQAGRAIYKQGRKGRKAACRKLDADAADKLVDIVLDNELWRLRDIARELSAATAKSFSHVDVCRGLKELGLKRVRVTNRANERDAAKRALFAARMPAYRRHQFVFIDEVATVGFSLCV